MFKRALAPSASSALRSSVVLSRAVEKTFALEAEVSRLRHHVSILSRRLHCTAKELSTLRASRDAPTPTDPPSSPTSTIVTVLGGGLDPESPRTFGGLAEELPRRNVAPTVIPSSPPPFEVVVAVGGPVSDFDSGWDVAPPSDCGGVEENPVAVSVAVAPSSEEVPEPSVTERVADREEAAFWGGTDEVVGDVGSSSAIVAPGSSSGKRRKSKKRRVQRDLTHPVPLVPESDDSSSPPRKQAGSGGPSTLAAVVELPPARAPWGAWRCSGPCRASTDGPADAFSPEDPPCGECGGRWELEGWY